MCLSNLSVALSVSASAPLHILRETFDKCMGVFLFFFDEATLLFEKETILKSCTSKRGLFSTLTGKGDDIRPPDFNLITW